MNSYIGKYRVFQEINLDTGKPTDNNEDTFLKCKYNSQVFRFDKNTLALLLTTGNSIKKVIPQLQELGVKLDPFVEGDGEAIYHFPEKQLDLVASIVKPMTKGKNISPKSKKTVKKLLK